MRIPPHKLCALFPPGKTGERPGSPRTVSAPLLTRPFLPAGVPEVVVSLHVTHRTASLPVLERLTEDRALVLSAGIQRRFPNVEVVFLRTGNHFELYVEGPAELRMGIREFLGTLRLAPGQFPKEGPRAR